MFSQRFVHVFDGVLELATNVDEIFCEMTTWACMLLPVPMQGRRELHGPKIWRESCNQRGSQHQSLNEKNEKG